MQGLISRGFLMDYMHISSIIFSFIRIIFIVYAILCLFLFVMQRSLIYRPNNINLEYVSLEENFSLTTLETPDKLKIKALWAKPKNNMILVYFHGNAASVYDRINKLVTWNKHGYGILAISYRGYGGSEGHPNEQGLYTDARTAIDSLIAQGYQPEQIILYGESLGSGVAMQMATEYDFKALVLEAPYTSIANRAAEIYWYVPVKLLIHDQFDSISKIHKVEEPIIIFHGKEDKVIPVIHGEILFNKIKSRKEINIIDGIEHTNFDTEEIIGKTEQFIK